MQTPASVIAVTMGDPAGIGPDISVAAWHAREPQSLPPFLVLGDPDMLSQRAQMLGIATPIRTVTQTGEAAEAFATALPVLPVSLPSPVQAGVPDGQSSSAIIASIEKAVGLVYSGEASAVVTNPISKALLLGTGFKHPGHTDFLGELARRHGDEAFPVMMLVCDAIRAVPTTVHIPIKDVPSALGIELIARTIAVTADALKARFGISAPRIAVTGLNPHAGEDGALGTEEIETIVPAIEAARSTGVAVSGPYPADTIFQVDLRDSYDAVVAMYHDQALIPVKTLAFETAVNLTIGLPFIRTSPDHGTAYALAGSGRANPSSLISAIKLAAQLAPSRELST